MAQSTPNEIINRIRWETDDSTQKRVTKAFNELKKDLREATDDTQVQKLGKRFAELAARIGLPDGAVIDLQNDLRKLGFTEKEVGKVAIGFEEVYREVRRAKEELERFKKIQLRQDEFDRVSRNVGLAGDIQSNLGALNALSGGSIGPAGEVFALIEELPRLKTALSGLPQTIAQAAATLGPAGLLVAGALATIALAFANYARGAEEQAKQMTATLEAQRNVSQQVIDGLTTEDAEAEIERLNKLREDELQRIRDIESAYDDNINSLGLLGTALKVVDTREEALVEQINKSKDAAADYEAQANALTRAIASGETAANDAAQSEEELAASRQQAASAAQQLAQLEKQAIDLRASYDQAAGDRLVDELNRQRDAREDAYRAEQQRAKQFNSAIEKAKEASNKRLAKLFDELNNLPLKRAQELRAAEVEAQEERADVIREYGEKSKQDAEDLNRELNKITASGEKERKRILEDSADSINQAMATGDVEALLSAERDRDKALRRSVEDEADTAKERADNFEVERRREQEAFQKRLADIQAGLAKEQQAIRDSYAQRRDELKTAIEEEKTAIKAYIDESTAAFLEREREIEEERRRQQQRRERDEAIAESRRQRDLNQQLTNLQQQANAITQVTYSTRELQVAARSLQATINSLRSATAAASRNSRDTAPRNSSSRSTPGRGASGPRFSAFATGGVIDELTYARMGEDARRGVYEAVIPFRKSEGIGPALDRMGIGGGGSREQFVFNITGQFTVGDIASKSEVGATFNEFGREIVGQVMGAVRNARRNSGRVA
jgi:hypothetical protein